MIEHTLTTLLWRVLYLYDNGSNVMSLFSLTELLRKYPISLCTVYCTVLIVPLEVLPVVGAEKPDASQK